MRLLLYAFLVSLITGCSQPKKAEITQDKKESAPTGMVWIPGGEFTMGTDDPESYEPERPAHRVKVTGFWMDATEVTNLQFKKFVEATGYVTMAEKKPEWEQLKKQMPPGTPRPPEANLVPGSLTFTPPSYAVNLNDYSQWWSFQPGCNWKHPEGPVSNIEDRWSHPVVQVSYDDAAAFSIWAKKRLPTEAEWEFASRGGRDGERYSWGSEFRPQGKYMANTFQGVFPGKNEGEDGFTGSSPVRTFPPNRFGLYDIIGNVWEWTNDYYNVNYYTQLAKSRLTINPMGPDKPYDPGEPFAQKRVTRGGSFLCATDYCVNFRPSARQGTAFDSGLSNVGFRCVIPGDAP